MECCHATLKLYLHNGHGDLRGVFLKKKLFWDSQYQTIKAIHYDKDFNVNLDDT
jgi:hypothetical protein